MNFHFSKLLSYENAHDCQLTSMPSVLAVLFGFHRINVFKNLVSRELLRSLLCLLKQFHKRSFHFGAQNLNSEMLKWSRGKHDRSLHVHSGLFNDRLLETDKSDMYPKIQSLQKDLYIQKSKNTFTSDFPNSLVSVTTI